MVRQLLIYQAIKLVVLTLILSSFSYYLTNNYKNITNNISAKTSLKAPLPISFEENLGQADKEVKFISHGKDYNLLLTSSKAILLTNAKEFESLELEFLGANSNTQLIGKNKLTTKTNYLLGDNENNWQKSVNNYKEVVYKELYPGIDLVFYGKEKNLEYDLVVAPKVDPGLVKLRFQELNNSHQTSIEIDKQGDLLIETKSGLVRQHKPFIYQEIEGRQIAINGSYKKHNDNTIGFSLAEYNQDFPLVIDPEISFSTYLGGQLTDQASAIAVDREGNSYIVGTTSSNNFPLVKPLQASPGGGPLDIFIAKLSADGSSLVYTTYLGGSSIDQAFDIAVDSSNNIYITGLTISSNFPTKSALQAQKGGGVFDAFVTKINASGSELVYSTYLGGNDDDQGFSLAVNQQGNVFVTGSTASRNFPGVTEGVLNGITDGFVTELNRQGTAVIYSRFLGGNDEDEASSIAIDSQDNAYITGDTFSPNFPVKDGVQANLAGGQDAFISKLNPSGDVIYSSYLGGTGNDSAIDIAVDLDGNAYITGSTASSNFPIKDALQIANAGGGDAFITKITANGKELIFSTYLGGTLTDNASSIALDPSGNIYVSGTTFSTNFPMLRPVQDKNKGNNDVFLTKINSVGNNLLYSTYLGGAGQDDSLGITVDTLGTTYLAGTSISTDFPVVNALQSVSAGTADAFIAKILEPLGPPVPDFSLSVTPSTQNIFAGSATSFTVNSRSINDFNRPINLSVNLTPSASNLTSSFAETTIIAGQSTTLTINTDANTPASNFVITITGRSDDLVRTTRVMLMVQMPAPNPDFSISVNPSQIDVNRRQTTTVNINVNRTGNFAGNVTITTSNNIRKILLTPTMQSTSGASVSFSFKVKRRAPRGTQQITFVGRDDNGRTRMATLMLNIR
ncbi:MAG: SBBP repeat-containing protein [Blastocatellia bacterium]|nr:SBBP repeat-containing protein [Blastocatellia bacterium]